MKKKIKETNYILPVGGLFLAIDKALGGNADIEFTVPKFEIIDVSFEPWNGQVLLKWFKNHDLEFIIKMSADEVNYVNIIKMIPATTYNKMEKILDTTITMEEFFDFLIEMVLTGSVYDNGRLDENALVNYFK